MKKTGFVLLLGFVFVLQAKAQYPTITLEEFQRTYRDSLMKINYNHIFPLLGKKTYKKGIDIPYPFGVMPAYFYQRQTYVIKDIGIAINKPGENNDLVDISNIVKFGTIEGKTNAFTVRPDIWVLPFLNIYGLIGGGQTVTSVQLIQPDISTEQIFSGVNYGLGATFAGAIGPVFLSLDANFSWVNFKELEKPVLAQNYSLRVGHVFNYSYRLDRNVSFWLGPFYQRVESNTEGDLALNEVFSADKIESIQANIDDWYNQLPLVEKNNPKIKELYDKLKSGISDLENSSVHYKLDKELEHGLNFILGFQYQHNKSWQFRTEIGTFGTRTQFLLSVNYRFL